MDKCSNCKKNLAVFYTTITENGQTRTEGLCMDCAKDKGIPVMDEIMKQMNMKPEDLDNLTKQMNDMFENINLDDMDPENPMMSFMNPSNNFEDMDVYEEDADFDQVNLEDDSNEESSKGKKNKKKMKKFKNLNKFGSNLNEKAKEGAIDRIIGRNREIDRLVQILNRRNKNNPLLIGEPGVGKTAIAEGLAVRIVEKQVPEKLFDAEVYLLDLTAIVAGTQFRGQFEGRMKAIINEAQSHGNVILVIDEVHNIMGAGEVHGGVMNAANILKPALARGELQICGATTLEDYRKHIEKDAALERRFQTILIEEPSIKDAIEILEGIKDYYESFHKVIISEEVIRASVEMSARYITDRYLPDKAIDVLDEAGSRANLKNKGLVEVKALQDDLNKIIELKEEASQHNFYEEAAEYKSQEVQMRAKLEAMATENHHTELTVEDIAYVIEAWTKIPVQKITEEEAYKLLALEERLHKRVIGQDKAVEVLAKAVRRNRSGFRRKKRPSSFVFVGPTGVGKTELAKTLAHELFGTENAMIRLDMSEYMEKHTVSKLIGAPPGYVGFDQGGQLTEQIKRQPYSVILMDEIEKAHPDVYNMLLQILEDGRLTDSQGRTVFFENTVIIMTSNAGNQGKAAYGIGFSHDQYSKMEEKINDSLREIFRPEFLNRIDDIVVFTKLSKDEQEKILDLMLKEVSQEAIEHDLTLGYTETLKKALLDIGYDEKYGARPLRRTIQKYVEDEIAEAFLRGKLKDHSSVTLDWEDNKVVFKYLS